MFPEHARRGGSRTALVADMTFDPTIHHRRSIRLQGYDYSQAGMYFVTLCTRNRECLFGEIVDETMRLNPVGQIVTDSWTWLAQRYEHVELDEWVVMPNHLHGIVVINDHCKGGSRTAPTKPIGRLIGAYKTVSTKQANTFRQTPGMLLWQRNYWERIVRDAAELLSIQEYICNNPAQWAQDKLHPHTFSGI